MFICYQHLNYFISKNKGLIHFTVWNNFSDKINIVFIWYKNFNVTYNDEKGDK